ncbi:MAG: 50S ribosomal protein L3 [Sulfobacillus benefaciens]|uniref:Large ribosomal subunit protein uL3 n=1 Tax=Sulfobacillus benefaciens TaxID=453960 RepID=A0A2T2X5A0_9FIRM|nr:MAG: 50S ribosomal protein L3 [Sulfobacillus benefaciens]
MKGFIGTKVGMTQVFDDTGRAIPVTVIHAEPNTVVRLRTPEKDGYEAVQLGVGAVRPHKLTQPLRKDFEKRGITPVRFLREFRLPGAGDLVPGSMHRIEDAFSAGDLVDVTGTSKGKGFAGVIKRWGFHRGPMSHGSKYHRRVGSLGSRTSGGGGRVHPGRKLPGHKGHSRVTVLKLNVVKVDSDRNLLLVRGAVPGPKGSLVMIRESVRNRKGAK